MQASIYERIGGAPSVKAAVDIFYEKVWADPALKGYFEGIDRSRLKAHQRAFVAAALGGPEVYNGRGMAEAHAGHGITDAAFYQVVAHLAATLAELGVDPDTIGQIALTLAPHRPAIVEGASAEVKNGRGVLSFLRG
ncbi:MAG: group I truncated hemoglobin [Egibacteraceae bacterium]